MSASSPHVSHFTSRSSAVAPSCRSTTSRGGGFVRTQSTTTTATTATANAATRIAATGERVLDRFFVARAASSNASASGAACATAVKASCGGAGAGTAAVGGGGGGGGGTNAGALECTGTSCVGAMPGNATPTIVRLCGGPFVAAICAASTRTPIMVPGTSFASAGPLPPTDTTRAADTGGFA